MPIRTGMAQGVVDALTSMGLSTGLTGVNWSLNWGGVDQYAVHSPWASSGHGDKIEFSFVADNPGTTNQYLFMSPTGNPYFDILGNASLYYRYIDADGTTVRTITGPTIVAGVLYVGHILMKGDGVDLVVNGTTYSTVNPQLLTTDLTHIAAHAPVSEYFNGTINYLRYVNATAIQNTYANIGDGVRYGELEQDIDLAAGDEYTIEFDTIYSGNADQQRWFGSPNSGGTMGLMSFAGGSDVQYYVPGVGGTNYNFTDALNGVADGRRIKIRLELTEETGSNYGRLFIDDVQKSEAQTKAASFPAKITNIYSTDGGASILVAGNTMQKLVVTNHTSGLTWNYPLDEGTGTDIINTDPSTQGNYNNEPIFDTDALMGDGARYIEIPAFTIPAGDDFEISFDIIRVDADNQTICGAVSPNNGITLQAISSISRIEVVGGPDIEVRNFNGNTSLNEIGKHARLMLRQVGPDLHLYVDGVEGAGSPLPAISGFTVDDIMWGRGIVNRKMPAGSALQNVILENLTTGEAIGYKINEGSGLDVIAYDIVNGEFGAPVPAKNGTITPDADWQYIPEYSNNGAWTPDTDWQFMPQLSRNYKMNDGPDALFLEDSLNPLGPELVTNGGFDTDSDWVISGGWVIDGGVATFPNGVAAEYVTQTDILTIGKTYEYSVDVLAADGGSSFPQLYTNAGLILSMIDGPGTYTGIFTSAGTDIRLRGVAGTVDIIVDNISVKDINTGATLFNVDPADWSK